MPTAWEWTFLAGFVVYAGIRHVFEHRVKRDAAPTIERRLDATEKILLAIVGVGMFMPFFAILSPWLDFAAIDLPEPVHWAGLATMLAALWLFRRSHADLGAYWSMTLELREGHRIVEHGVYRRIRHPMYASVWLWSAAQALLIDNWLAGPAALVTFAPLYFVRTPREEALLRGHFGSAYREYERRTGRLWPRVRGARGTGGAV